MKNCKHFTVVALLAIFGIVGIFIGCDDGNNNNNNSSNNINSKKGGTIIVKNESTYTFSVKITVDGVYNTVAGPINIVGNGERHFIVSDDGSYLVVFSYSSPYVGGPYEKKVFVSEGQTLNITIP
jgi:hypothetical protein